LLTGCGKTITVVKTEYQQVYLPDRFLVDCPVPAGKSEMTFREGEALSARRKSALIDCNLQLKSAREYQDEIRARESAVINSEPE
jgi:hypothetical protein